MEEGRIDPSRLRATASDPNQLETLWELCKCYFAMLLEQYRDLNTSLAIVKWGLPHLCYTNMNPKNLFFFTIGRKRGLYSPTIIKNILCLILQVFCFQFSEVFECNTTSDWLNHTV